VGSLLRRDSCPITPSPFLNGTAAECDDWSRSDTAGKLQPMLSGFHIDLVSL
jgi:hypothetical protein